MSKFHEHEGINNVSKTKNGLPNVVSAILCLLSLIAFATLEQKTYINAIVYVGAVSPIPVPNLQS